MKKNIYKTRTFFLAFALAWLSFNFSAKAAIYPFSQTLTGAQEAPPNASPGTGTIVGAYNDVTNTIFYTITFSGLTSVTVAGHFHAPAPPGVNAPVIIPYAGFPVGVTSGTYSNAHVITDLQEAQLFAGLWYSNIHTATLPGGEIRAQIILGAPSASSYTFNATLTGMQEAPPNTSPGTGNITGIYNSATNTIFYSINFSGLTSPTVAGHFHAPAPPGFNAPVIIPYTGFPTGVTSGTYSNVNVVTDLQETQLFAGLWYSNIHTVNFPGGEIRAQIFLQPTFLNDLTIVLNTTCGLNDGNITIIPISGTPPFMYSINGGATYVPGPNTGLTFQNLAPGTYQLRLKDAAGVESEISTRTITPVYGFPAFRNDSRVVLDASCGRNDGNITIEPTSGTPPFMYSIDGGKTYVSGPNSGYTFTNLAAGTYQLRLKTATGCESAIVERTVRNVYGCPGAITGINSGIDSKISAAGVEANRDVITTYPNPSNGQFKVLLQNFASPKAEVLVVDGKGAIIQKRSLNLNQNTITDFDLKGKARGMYYIRVVSSNGTKVSKVLVQ